MGIIAISVMSGDGDARLEIGGILRYTALHQRFSFGRRTCAAIFLFWVVDRRAHLADASGGAGVNEGLQVRKPHSDAPRAELDDLQLSTLMTAPQGVGAHACEVSSLGEADNFVGKRRIRRQLGRWGRRHVVARRGCYWHERLRPLP
jgi:hypothetical protein